MNRRVRAVSADVSVAAANLLAVSALAPSADAATQAAPVHLTATTATYPAPSTSPSLPVGLIGPQIKQYFCDPEYLCAFIDTAPSGYYRIEFYRCQRYSLAQFIDPSATGTDSVVIDDQSAGTTTVFYGKSGNVLQTMHPINDEFQSVLLNKGGWNPVYSIKVC